MGSIYKRGSNYWAYYNPAPGVRERVSLRTKDRQIARERLRELESVRPDHAENKSETLGESLRYILDVCLASNPHSTRRSYDVKARHLIRLIGDIDLADLDREQVGRFIATRIESEGASTHTVYKELVVLRRALTEATDRDRFHLPIAKVIPRFKADYKPRKRWLSDDDVAALCEQLTPERAEWITLAVLTGARHAELESLQWDDYDAANRTLVIAGTKTKTAHRTIPVTPSLAAFLDSLGGSSASGPIVAPWGNVRRDLAIACNAAGIDPVTPNDLRRTFASRLKQRGVDSFLVASMLGHTSSRMVEAVYGRVDLASLARAAESADVFCTPGVHANTQDRPKMATNGNHKASLKLVRKQQNP